MPEPDLSKLFKPRSVAVVGVSPDRPLIGTRAYRNLRRYNYPGRLYPINPRYESFDGDPCFASLSALPEVPDFAFLAIPAARTPEVVEECARLGIKAIEVASGGYGESGSEGAALESRITATARAHGIALCGPNNIGLINIHDRSVTWPSPMAGLPKPGRIAVLTQSGSVGIVLCQDERKLGLAYLVSSGNEAVLTAADYLGFFAEDERVRVVLMFLETIREPRKFAEAATRARANGKHVVVLKVGRSALGSRAVAAHTGAIAGEAALYDAFFRRYGILAAKDMDGMLELAALLDAYPEPPPTPHVVPVTLSGGEAALLADLAGEQGVSLPELAAETVAKLQPHFPAFQRPRNPLDAYGLGWDSARIEGMFRALAEDPAIGTVAVAFDAPASDAADAKWTAEAAEMCGRLQGSTKARFVFMNNLAAGGMSPLVRERVDAVGIPFLSGMSNAFAALGQWTALARACPAAGRATPLPAAIAARARDVEKLGEAERFDLLRDAGLPMSACRPVGSADEAVHAARAFGRPVAMKAGGAAVLHKTELGLVRLALADDDAIRGAFRDLTARMAAAKVNGEITVQPMAGPGLELILGARVDPGFGPLIVVGLGGTYVEVLKSASLRLAPLGIEEARAMLGEGPMGTLLAGVRGRGPYDVEAAARAIVALSDFALGTGDRFAAVEINPLIVLEKGQGAVGVDLVLEPKKAG
ncbi:MAG: acetate--CoA ligase family protein [Alphaproteobacteria bacterium]